MFGAVSVFNLTQSVLIINPEGPDIIHSCWIIIVRECTPKKQVLAIQLESFRSFHHTQPNSKRYNTGTKFRLIRIEYIGI